MQKRGQEGWQIVLLGEIIVFVVVFFGLIYTGQRFSHGETIDRVIQARDISLYINTIQSLPGNIILDYPSRPNTILGIQPPTILVFPQDKSQPASYTFTIDNNYNFNYLQNLAPLDMKFVKEGSYFEINNGLSSTLSKRYCYNINTKNPGWLNNQIFIYIKEPNQQITQIAESLKASLMASAVKEVTIVYSYPESSENSILILLKIGSQEKIFMPVYQESQIKRNSKLFCLLSNKLNYKIDFTSEEHPIYQAAIAIELKQDSNLDLLKNSIKESLVEYYG